MNPLEERVVKPFYLRLMGLNAIWRDPDIPEIPWRELIAAGPSIELADAKWLLNVGAWRPLVMGAWFSLRFTPAEIGPELRQAMRASAGSLTAPVLATACVLLVGTEALPDLAFYVNTDPGGDGSAEFVAAAAEHVGAPSSTTIPDDSDRERPREMLGFGRRLRHAMTAEA